MYDTNEKSGVDVELALAVTNLGLPTDAFIKCERDLAQQIVQNTKKVFVEGEPQRWLTSLKTSKVMIRCPDGGFRHLLEYVPLSQESCWFIPGTRATQFVVYDAQIKYIIDILGNSYAFEYYLVGKCFDWLIAEDDEDQLIVSFVQPE